MTDSQDDDEVAVCRHLGIPSDLLHTDTFKVNRPRIELLIFGDDVNPPRAEEFFQDVMEKTSTKIYWPTRIKKGAKTKRDPFMRVLGLAENVEAAKKLILEKLQTESNSVTIKMEMSYMDHAYIIGRGGRSIRAVMQETQCHIHFPDSNKTNRYEKSNQVSIKGLPQAVEKARATLREMSPVTFNFNLVTVEDEQKEEEEIRAAEAMFEVEVKKVKLRYGCRQIVVKGPESHAAKVKEAVLHLLRSFVHPNQVETEVEAWVEVCERSWSVVAGTETEGRLGVEQRTGTRLTVSRPNNTPPGHILVAIRGPVHGVHLAKHQLIGSLPVTLIFDVPGDVDMTHLEGLMAGLDVVLASRPKTKQRATSILLRGHERNIGNLYEARRQLLRLEEEPLLAKIPSTFLVPPSTSFRAAVTTGNPNSVVGEKWKRTESGVEEKQIESHGCAPPPGFKQIPPAPLFSLPVVSAAAHTVSHPFQQSLTRQAYSYSHPLQVNQGGEAGPRDEACGGQKSGSVSSFLQALGNHLAVRPNPLPCSSSQLNEKRSRKEEVIKDQKEDEWKLPEEMPGSQQLSNLKVAVVIAMGKPACRDKVRVPTKAWSGHGFSLSSPQPLFTDTKSSASSIPSEGKWPDCKGDWMPSQSDYLSDGRTNLTRRAAAQTSVATVLAAASLEKYNAYFKCCDIDLETFKQMNEGHLIEIGVTSYVDRKKILQCIAEMKRKEVLSKELRFPDSRDNSNLTMPTSRKPENENKPSSQQFLGQELANSSCATKQTLKNSGGRGQTLLYSSGSPAQTTHSFMGIPSQAIPCFAGSPGINNPNQRPGFGFHNSSGTFQGLPAFCQGTTKGSATNRRERFRSAVQDSHAKSHSLEPSHSPEDGQSVIRQLVFHEHYGKDAHSGQENGRNTQFPNQGKSHRRSVPRM